MRVLKHLFAPSAKRLFPTDALQRIAALIATSEAVHTGEICFAVEPNLHPRAVLAGMTAHQRAREVFARLGVWDTRANNGVLLYLLLADHRIEIVADRGLAGRVSDAQWREVCQLIETGMEEGRAEQGVLDGIAAASALLARHFPQQAGDADEDELPNRPHLLD